ncbi:hypothetical protein DV735_g2206, partial [Chaetothyriales sp. CBS 134920]
MEEDQADALTSTDVLIKALRSSSTRLRIEAVRKVQQHVENGDNDNGDAAATAAPQLFLPLLATYPLYLDRKSRRATQSCLQAYLRSSRLKDRYQTALIEFIVKESQKPVVATGSAFVLLEWVWLAQDLMVTDTAFFEASFAKLCPAAALLLDKVEQGHTRASVEHSSLVIARRGLRLLLRSPGRGPSALRVAVQALTSGPSTPSNNAAYIGVLSGVSSRIPPRKAEFHQLSKNILDWYIKHLLGSKAPVPHRQALGLTDFFTSFVTLQDLSDIVFPAIEKSILRSGEIVLQGPITALAESLPATLDVIPLVHAKLLKPLLSSMNSANTRIRDGAAQSLIALISRGGDAESLTKVATELGNALKTAKSSNSELRLLLAEALSVFAPNDQLSVAVVQSMTLAATKETNETALKKELGALASHLPYLVQGGVIDKKTADSIVKSSNDKRPPFRKAWHLSLATTLLALKSLPGEDSAQGLVSSSIGLLNQVHKEIVPNPLPATQSGLVAASFALPALIGSPIAGSESGLIDEKVLVDEALTSHPSASYLINSKVYSKLSADDDLQWLSKALTGVASGLESTDEDSRVLWARAVLHLLLEPDTAPSVRRETSELLANSARRYAAVGSSIVSGAWSYLKERQAANATNTEGALPLADIKLLAILRTALPPSTQLVKDSDGRRLTISESHAIDTIVLLRPELIAHADWIEMCLSRGVDPGQLTSRSIDGLLQRVLSCFNKQKFASLEPIEIAASNAVATLAFVAPEVAIPRIVQQFTLDLAPEQLADLGPSEAVIARAPEGTLVVDVLAQKSNSYVEDKNRKDYDVLKWEEEVRKQLAEKKGSEKKLSPEKQAKVDAQLRLESEIRQTAHQVSASLRRGAGFINALATGPPTETRLWMSSAISALIDALKAGGSLFVDNELVSAYLACSHKVAERLGTIREFIGLATLRSIRNTTIRPELTEEPLTELVTRVLYRLRFAAEQRPFDTASLAYILPLVFSVLEQNGVGDGSREDKDAHVLLSLEFLSYQMSSCSDIYLPRSEVLRWLLTAMRKYPQHHRIIRDSVIEFGKAIADTLTETERQILLSSVTLSDNAVRAAALQCIHDELDLTDSPSSVHIWIACQDPEDDNAELALAIWEESGFEVTKELVHAIPAFLFDAARSVRLAAAQALAQALTAQRDEVGSVIDDLRAKYNEEAQPLVPKADKRGIVQRGELVDPWERRSGIALAFTQLASVIPKAGIVPLVEFLVSRGAVADRHHTVRAEMVEAGKCLVQLRGSECLEQLMTIFEQVLQKPDQKTPEYDWTNEATIVLYGSLAQHLPESDKRLDNVVSKLTDTLKTPSESVQYAVGMCLQPLLRSKNIDAGPYVTSLMDQLLQAKQYAARRGAAYGLAGIFKGKGIAGLRQYRILSALKAASENKKSASSRQGAMFAYETFSLLLGQVFEPYVIYILPQLLACFGDPDPSVRAACLDTAKTCFSSLSSYGVRKILPQLLEGLDDTQWRSKKGACDLLGAMAYLDPQQLATSLPDIIPPLTAVLTDSHKEVRASANKSLQRFGEVIQNPEIKSLVDVLLKALSDPTKYTEEALDGLIKVSFAHYLDAPSLALVVRILERGLGDRSSTKRKAAQIIGSLANLTEKKDIVVHLPILVHGLRLATVDPVPATRATASKALGGLVEKLGEDAFPDLIPSLMSALRTDTGAGDRLGSAQALSEVLAGLGTGRLEETLPTILQNVSSTRATVREGFMTLFIFLPACFGNSFANYLGQIIPSVLSGLADDVEAIRETALRAGRLLVKNFATKAIDLLLPELQRGLADDSHRIRLSSVELIGDLLFSLTGASMAEGDDEADEEQAAQAGQSLLDVLGEERRDRVLSSIYICRCDTSGVVRAAAVNVWKALVPTPKILKEIVPTLIQMIIGRLASSNAEQKVIAGNALGEVIRKAGEGVFSSLLPSLEESLQSSTNPDHRQGICIALREIVDAASPDALEEHEKQLIGIVRIALVDSDADVRDAAAESFDSLQQEFGKRAVDQVLPHLLSLLRSEEDASNALSALLTLLAETTRANVILPNLIPTLLVSPMTAFNARALASLARVSGSSMTRRLPVVLNTLADNLIACKEAELRPELEASFDAVLASVDEYDGLNTAMSVMLAMMKHDDHRRRAVAANRLATFFAAQVVDYSRYNQDLIRVLLISFGDRDKEVVTAAWSALSQLQSHLKKEEMESLVGPTKQVLQQAGTAGSILAGFALPKGIHPVLQIFLQGLMNGTADQRVQAAMGISDIIDRAGPDSLKPYVTHITGPLIRVVGERSLEVKCAILFTLSQLLEKIPTFLRPFLPQLQRTFTKSMADPSSELLRSRAIKALGILITLTPRVDPLVAELVTGAKTADSGVRDAMTKGLQEVVSKVGANMSDSSRESILALMDSQHEMEKDTHARLLGSMINVLSAEKAAPLIKSRVLVQPSSSASILALNAVLRESPKVLLASYDEETRSAIVAAIGSKTVFVQQNALLAAGKYLLAEGTISDEDSCRPIFGAVAAAIAPGGDIDSRRLGLVVVRTVSRHHADEVKPFLAELIPSVFASVRDPVIPVKLAAEAAFLELFNVVDEESAVFDEYMAGPGKASLPVAQQRPISDYFKRVALRLGSQARERREAEGGTAGTLGLSRDEQEDEREVWSVGRVEVEASAEDE